MITASLNIQDNWWGFLLVGGITFFKIGNVIDKNEIHFFFLLKAGIIGIGVGLIIADRLSQKRAQRIEAINPKYVLVNILLNQVLQRFFSFFFLKKINSKKLRFFSIWVI